MPEPVKIAVALAYAYLVGSIPTAYLVARWAQGIDIRRYGSGNVGASNVRIHVGGGPFALVSAFDVLVKGTLSAAIPGWFGLDVGYQVVAGLLAMLGHSWSVYLRFAGGRGVSVVLGALLVVGRWELAAALAFVGAATLLYREVALWFAIAFVALPVLAVVLREPLAVQLFCLAVPLATALKRVVANPGTAPPGAPWRKLVLPRLLYDRDTMKGEGWTTRTPPP
ncbi:MAG: glycerol-3-phosphate acyltransferase [Chloroflexi bacterium]|nr:glycerol-3-phosphate acyltransferase [Chloroflexota bacterium]